MRGTGIGRHVGAAPRKRTIRALPKSTPSRRARVRLAEFSAGAAAAPGERIFVMESADIALLICAGDGCDARIDGCK